MNFKETPDECVEPRFFNVDEASQEDLFPQVEKFIEVFNPDLHI